MQSKLRRTGLRLQQHQSMVESTVPRAASKTATDTTTQPVKATVKPTSTIQSTFPTPTFPPPPPPLRLRRPRHRPPARLHPPPLLARLLRELNRPRVPELARMRGRLPASQLLPGRLRHPAAVCAWTLQQRHRCQLGRHLHRMSSWVKLPFGSSQAHPVPQRALPRGSRCDRMRGVSHRPVLCRGQPQARCIAVRRRHLLQRHKHVRLRGRKQMLREVQRGPLVQRWPRDAL